MFSDQGDVNEPGWKHGATEIDDAAGPAQARSLSAVTHGFLIAASSSRIRSGAPLPGVPVDLQSVQTGSSRGLVVGFSGSRAIVVTTAPRFESAELKLTLFGVEASKRVQLHAWMIDCWEVAVGVFFLDLAVTPGSHREFLGLDSVVAVVGQLVNVAVFSA